MGAEYSSTSCDLGIFVDQPAYSIDPHDPCAGRWSRRCDGSQRWHLVERAVWPMFVVVGHILSEQRLQLLLAEDQHPVEQLTMNGADPPFRERVRPRRQHTCPQDTDALRAEDGIEAVGELCIPVADEEPELPRAIPEVHEQVAGLLGRHPQDQGPQLLRP